MKNVEKCFFNVDLCKSNYDIGDDDFINGSINFSWLTENL